jgi:ABC-2 type transport system ATP-binding protein
MVAQAGTIREGAFMTDRAAAELRGVWKRYSRSAGWVLRGADLTIAEGAVTVVLGGNADGKSTLLRIVAGASTPTRGVVRCDRRSVSYVPEKLPADLRMTAHVYLGHMARLRGRAWRSSLARSLELLDVLRLSPGPDVPIAQLSKGNRQKVSLAQAFGAATRLTVLDEPFSGLDETASAGLRLLVADARANGRSVLISAHHPASLEQYDAFHRLRDGQLQALPPSAIRQPWPDTSRQVRIVLRAVTPAASSSRLTDLPGVRSIDQDPVDGLLQVVTGEPDELLRAALDTGWSFVEAEVRVIEAEAP